MLTIGILANWQLYDGTTVHRYLHSLLSGAYSAARDCGCQLLLSCGVGSVAHPYVHRPGWPVPTPNGLFVPVGPWNCDGLVIVPPITDTARDDYIAQLLAVGYPLVFAGVGGRSPAVMLDNAGGIAQVVAHLYAHGHRRIALLAGYAEGDDDSTERRRAFHTALQAHGLTPEPALIVFGKHNFVGGKAAMQELLARGQAFSAIVASNDESAFGAMEALREAGLRIPEDVAITGFDDVLDARIQNPPLTTVHVAPFELGYRAVLMLDRSLHGTANGNSSQLIATRLIVRRSCGGRIQDSGFRIQDSEAGRLHSETGVLHASDPGTWDRLIQRILDAALTEAQRLQPEALRALCDDLVTAFQAAMAQGDPAVFHAALITVLRRTEALGEDVAIWQEALSVLRKEALAAAGEFRIQDSGFRSSRSASEVRSHPAGDAAMQSYGQAIFVGELIDQGRLAISERIRRQGTRSLVQQMDAADRLGMLTAQLLAIFDEAHLSATLATQLVNLGIRHVLVARYEPDEDDATAWSHVVLHFGLAAKVPQRFRTRSFPTPDMYPDDMVVQLALLPLIIEEQVVGFMAFDAANFEPCAAIMRNLASALQTSKLYREAREGRRLAEEANRLKSRFLSMVSHELRTPLNLIAGLGDMLLRNAAPTQQPEQRADLERIVASAQHLDLLINDVLDLASSDIGQLRVDRAPLDLSAALQMVAVTGERLAHERGLSWRAELPHPGPQIFGDRTRLRQVVLNLISNAVKFTNQGQVVFTLETEQASALIRVRDSGVGIDPADMPHIFDEFRQGQRRVGLGYRGLGLGLAICKQLVALHDGTIEVQSSGVPGEGALFTVRLPLLQDSGFRLQASEGVSPGAEGATTSQAVLLLADDLVAARLIQQGLQERGVTVDVQQGDIGLDALRDVLAQSHAAVLLDEGCATRRGWQIEQLLKQDPATADCALVIVSLNAQADAGALFEWQHLNKPLDSAQIALLLNSLATQLPATKQRTLLIVEDDDGLRDLHRRLILAHAPHYTVRSAAHGRAALDQIATERPDLILLDLMMPEMDGFALLDVLRADASLQSIPVVVLTAQRLSDEDLERLSSGVSAVLTKGVFNAEELFGHLRSAIERQRKRGNVTQRLVHRALAFIHAHYNDAISREQIAAYVGVNENYLTDCFHREMGLTPMSYLARYRVQHAQQLLLHSDQSITAIALAVGFSDSAYFSRVFQRITGSSPSAYRRNTRPNT